MASHNLTVTYRPLKESDKNEPYIVAIESSGSVITCFWCDRSNQWFNHEYPDCVNLWGADPIKVLEFSSPELKHIRDCHQYNKDIKNLEGN